MDGSLRDAAAQIWLMDCSGPERSSAEQGAAHVNLDWEAASHQRYFRHDDKIELVGDWHSHPSANSQPLPGDVKGWPSGNLQPSPGDVRGWARAHQLHRCPWVGLLFYRENGWVADVYVTHTERGRVVCDRGPRLEELAALADTLRPCLACGRPSARSRCAKHEHDHDQARRNDKAKAHGLKRRAWQRLRRERLELDGYRCQLRLDGCTLIALRCLEVL